MLAAPSTPRVLLDNLAMLGWSERTVGDMRIFQVPAESELRYVDVKGDYWGSTSEWDWMGRRITITTHNRATRLRVKGWGFTGNGSRNTLHVTINGTTTDYSADDADGVTLDLPANARIDVETEQTFVPDNGDVRALGALISLQLL